MEGGWVKKTHGNSIKGDGYNDFADVRHENLMKEKVLVNMMDLRYSSDIINGETYSWFNDAYGLVQEFIAEGGYRLYPDKISVPYEVANGSTLRITHRWSNLGWDTVRLIFRNGKINIRWHSHYWIKHTSAEVYFLGFRAGAVRLD